MDGGVSSYVKKKCEIEVHKDYDVSNAKLVNGKGGSETLSGTRFPENPNQLFPENYAGLTKEIKPNGNIDFTVEAEGKHIK